MSFPHKHRQRKTSVGPRLDSVSLARINKDGRAQLWPLWEGFNRFCCVGLYCTWVQDLIGFWALVFRVGG